MIRAGFLLVLLGCASPLQRELERVAAAHAPCEVAIAYRDLGTGEEALVRADKVLHAASTMKVPVMIELFRQADAGELAMTDAVTVENRFRSIVDGSTYSLSPDDDSERELYRRVGARVPMRELVAAMIRRSSNLATNILIARAQPRRVQRTVEVLGARRMQVRRGVEDILAYRQGLNNTATARDLMELMAAIAEHRAASPAACEEMVGILAGQEFEDLIPAGLPPGTKVAHKTGRITGIRHDAAIVYPAGEVPYVLVVLTRGFEDQARAAAAIVGVARSVHAWRTGH